MLNSNYQYLREFKNKVKNIPIRCEIEFLDTFIGSYKARKTKREPQDFKIGRITAQIYESEQIAKQREKTLELLGKKPSLKLIQQTLKKLTKQINPILENGSIEKDGLYSYFQHFIESQNLRCIAGERLEIRLKNNKPRISENMTEGSIKKAFLYF